MSDRESVLSRIRRAIPRESGTPTHTCSRPDPGLTAGFDEAALARTFRKEAEDQAVQVHDAADTDEACRILGGILERLGAKTAFSWNAPFPGKSAVVETLRALGIQNVTPAPEPPGSAPDRNAFKASAARADVGITGTDFALADTGTLVLLSAPGKSRSSSLLPPVHVVLLPVSCILPDLPSLLSSLPRTPAAALERGSAVTLITGTSKTADIELTLVRGVHGPGEVHVIMMSSPSP